MPIVRLRSRRAIPTALGVLTLLSVGVLLAIDAAPRLFAAGVHDVLAALPLVLIALAYVVYQAVQRVRPTEWAKTILLALAFLFWAANQFWSERRMATLFNDIAIAAFVLDVFLVIIGWPAGEVRWPTGAHASGGVLGTTREGPFAETRAGRP